MQTESEPTKDTPQRIRAKLVATRYTITERLAGDWIRGALAAGAIKKLRGVIVGRWSALDAWVAAGGESPTSKRRGGR